MKADVKEKWLAALTSGEYQQADGVLARIEDDGVSYCCLGVLCDVIADEAGLIVEETQAGYSKRLAFDSEPLVLPRKAQQFAGLAREIPEYNFEVVPGASTFDYDKNEPIAPFDLRGNYVELHLASLNDEGFTFEQIADIIRWAEPAE